MCEVCVYVYLYIGTHTNIYTHKYEYLKFMNIYIATFIKLYT